MTDYPKGMPCWGDLAATDRYSAMDLYHAMFGWDYAEGPQETGYYTQAQRGGRSIAGIYSVPPEQSSQSASWTMYFATDDADETASAITQQGGALLTDVIDVMGEGRMLLAVDPAGAIFGAWQSNQFAGASLVNEPGAVAWNELVTVDGSTASSFYTNVFGLRSGQPAMDGFDYRTLCPAGRDVAGIWAFGEAGNPDNRPHWETYFAVVNTDAAVRVAMSKGGTLVSAPKDTPYGRLATIEDAQGARFSVISMFDAGKRS